MTRARAFWVTRVVMLVLVAALVIGLALGAWLAHSATPPVEVSPAKVEGRQ